MSCYSADLEITSICADFLVDDAVGYKRPPKAYRWKKGQCGNPRRKRKRELKGAAEIIDQLFAKPVSFVEDGSVRKASGLAVIVSQLVKRQIAGERRAMNVRLRYETFAVRQNGVVTLSKRRREADCCAKLQTAAATSRHVVIAAARSTRCVWADMRWRWTLKML
jgi:Family of unknown function (DUF5681)